MNAPWAPSNRSARSDVGDRIRAYGAMTRPVVRDFLQNQAPAPYLHDLLSDYPERSGKMMRPALCLAATEASGGAAADALPSAAAIELFHTAVLIHDDVQDDSDVRRGRPTLHRLHGAPLAINAGDALMLLALGPLIENTRRLPHHVAAEILACTRRMAQESAEGQALELGWRAHNRTDVTEADYLTMVLKKTAWMSLIWPLQIGLLIGSRGKLSAERVERFGFFLGAAFQIQDDLLNLVADRAYGKEPLGDLFEGKRTLMLIHARRTADAGGQTLVDRVLAVSRADRSRAMVEDLAALIERQGSAPYARIVAEALAGAARSEFDRAFEGIDPSPQTAFIAGLVTWVFERG